MGRLSGASLEINIIPAFYERRMCDLRVLVSGIVLNATAIVVSAALIGLRNSIAIATYIKVGIIKFP